MTAYIIGQDCVQSGVQVIGVVQVEIPANSEDVWRDLPVRMENGVVTPQERANDASQKEVEAPGEEDNMAATAALELCNRLVTKGQYTFFSSKLYFIQALTHDLVEIQRPGF